MKKVLLFGATGNLGRAIAREVVKRGYELTVAVRSAERAELLSDSTRKHLVVDPCCRESVTALRGDFEIVISALGKSVSPNDKSLPSFKEVDLDGNTNILEWAQKAGIRKFIYVSAFHSEKYQDLAYFRVHHEFSMRLIRSGINYSVIKPPAIFSAFLDVIAMARKKQLVNLGPGDRKTNPIYEGDLAAIVVDSIAADNAIVEAGGKTIYTRRQLNEIVNSAVNGRNKLTTVPLFAVRALLPLLKFFDRNAFDKFAFFIEVMQHDTIAPQLGEMTFEEYVKQNIGG